MATLHRQSFTVILVLLSVKLTSSADSPEFSPSPSPQLSGAHLSSPPDVGTPSSPSAAHEISSPPAPPPSDLASPSVPSPAPTNSPSKTSPSSPPAVASNVTWQNAESEEAKDSSGGGLNGGQKAGIAVGVIAGACIVGIAGLVYKKRQQNIQRSQFGYAARRELL